LACAGASSNPVVRAHPAALQRLKRLAAWGYDVPAVAPIITLLSDFGLEDGYLALRWS